MKKNLLFSDLFFLFIDLMVLQIVNALSFDVCFLLFILSTIFYLKYFPGLTFSCSNTCCLLILTPSSSCLFFMVFLTATGDVFMPWITCVHLFLVDTEETWQEEPVDGR